MKTHHTTASQGRHFRSAGTACLMLFLLLAGMAPAHGAGIFRVDAASTAPTPDGQSWETAYGALHLAASAAAAAGGGELWVKAGTYTGPGEQVVLLSGGVDLYGGFAGTETDRAQRDWKANETVIDGQNAQRCVTCTANATVDGFTVARGLASLGGGMLGMDGAAVNCTFVGNSAAGAGPAAGGGMYGGTATNCTFMGNSATATLGTGSSYGGGMCLGTATNCSFVGNSATGVGWAYGGGMHQGTAINCTFMGNSAAVTGMDCRSHGGGMYGSTATNCTFMGNSATAAGYASESLGGGMFFGFATNCIFWGNTAAYTPEIYDADSVTYSCVRGGYPGDGNIADNPKFADAPYDLRLLPGSPCLDTGTAAGAPAYDLLGKARPQGAGVDMGAYESAALGVPHAPVVGADASGANPPTWTWTPGGGGIGQYRFGFAEGIWEIVDLAATAYTPPIPLPAGGRTLYVQERDAAGNWSASGAHTLTVADTAPPTGTIVINGNAATTASATVALALTWDDGLNGSGVSRMRFSNDGTTWSPWEKQASLKSWPLPAGTGYKTVRAQFLDRSGNRSAVCSDYIKVVVP